MKKLQLDYFTPESALQHNICVNSEVDTDLNLAIPRLLFDDNRFKVLSSGAKILYSLLLNKVSQTIENGWSDEQNRVYIIYPNTEITVDMRCSKDKLTRLMKELREIGLIKTVQQGVGKPNFIYVKKLPDQNY